MKGLIDVGTDKGEYWKVKDYRVLVSHNFMLGSLVRIDKTNNGFEFAISKNGTQHIIYAGDIEQIDHLTAIWTSVNK